MWTEADIRLMIHSVREGEFDPYELQLFQQFKQDEQQTRRQSVLVLTQIDQAPDQDVLAHIIDSIKKQAPDANIMPVSATRHRQGLVNSKPLTGSTAWYLKLQLLL